MRFDVLLGDANVRLTAAALGVHRSTVQRWKAGKYMPTPRHQKQVIALWNLFLRAEEVAEEGPVNEPLVPEPITRLRHPPGFILPASPTHAGAPRRLGRIGF
jgi:hypothetical protein